MTIKFKVLTNYYHSLKKGQIVTFDNVTFRDGLPYYGSMPVGYRRSDKREFYLPANEFKPVERLS